MNIHFFSLNINATDILARVYEQGEYRFYRVRFCNNGEVANRVVNGYRMTVDVVGKGWANMVLESDDLFHMDNVSPNVAAAVALTHAEKGE